jgi:hypothetical protein
LETSNRKNFWSYRHGKLYSSSGQIGGWTISTDCLTRAASSKNLSIWLGATGDYTAKISSPIGQMNGAEISNLVFRFGANTNAVFGVGADGKLYASAGVIGGLRIATNELIYSTTDLVCRINPRDGITLGDIDDNSDSKFHVDPHGTVYCY